MDKNVSGQGSKTLHQKMFHVERQGAFKFLIAGLRLMSEFVVNITNSPMRKNNLSANILSPIGKTLAGIMWL
jgi:hypothetical protein